MGACSPRVECGGLLAVHVTRGSTWHALLCDAFLLHGGYVAIDGYLFEILTVDPDTYQADAFTWTARRATYAGRA